jgi:hypothetical protein
MYVQAAKPLPIDADLYAHVVLPLASLAAARQRQQEEYNELRRIRQGGF